MLIVADNPHIPSDGILTSKKYKINSGTYLLFFIAKNIAPPYRKGIFPLIFLHNVLSAI